MKGWGAVRPLNFNMPNSWDQTSFDAHYYGNIGWNSPTNDTLLHYDPDNDPTADPPTNRIGESYVGIGLDFARYSQRFNTDNQIAYPYYQERARRIDAALRQLPGASRANTILIVGSELGYTLNSLRNLDRSPGKGNSDKYLSVFGIDNSAYIESLYNAIVDNQRMGDEDVIFEDWLDYSSRAVKDKLEAMTGGFSTFDFILNAVTESYDLANIGDIALWNQHLLSNTQALVGSNETNIINLVDTPLDDIEFNPYDPPAEFVDDDSYQTHVDHNTTIRSMAAWQLQAPSQSWLNMLKDDHFLIGAP